MNESTKTTLTEDQLKEIEKEVDRLMQKLMVTIQKRNLNN